MEQLPDLTCELCVAGISKAKRNAFNWPENCSVCPQVKFHDKSSFGFSFLLDN